MNDLPRSFTVWQPAPLDARFDPDAWSEQVGRPVTVTLPGPPPRTVERVLRSATVDIDGTGAQLTFEAADGDG